MPAMAISAALSAMAAQTIGAGLVSRLGKITRAGLILNITITGTLTLLLLGFDRPVLTLFLGPTSPAVDAARHIQFLASWSYISFGITIVLFGTMRAGGVVIAPIVAPRHRHVPRPPRLLLRRRTPRSARTRCGCPSRSAPPPPYRWRRTRLPPAPAGATGARCRRSRMRAARKTQADRRSGRSRHGWRQSTGCFDEAAEA